MICIETTQGWRLIGQHDHALLSGQLGLRMGNGEFAAVDDDAALWAMANHDLGWREHDQAPTLDSDGRPHHVFQTPLLIALDAWRKSSRLAAAHGPWEGLLVSLHGLGLSAIPAARRHSPREVFELSKFQHEQVELQHAQRDALGMGNDLPTHYGLPLENHAVTAREELLLFQLRWLQAMDQFSLVLCCRQLFISAVEPAPSRPGRNDGTLSLALDENGTLRIGPWPFAQKAVRVTTHFRQLNKKCWSSRATFLADYHAAATQPLELALEPAP